MHDYLMIYGEMVIKLIMAIVADTLETPLNELHFKSIKQVGEESKSWYTKLH